MVTLGFFVAGFLFGSFVEYWGHRLMHQPRAPFARKHREHHAANTGQGVVKEFWDYFRPTGVLLLPMFLVSLEAGIGWAVGTFTYMWFSAFGHQLQHENPTKCFWMRMPVHFVHHSYHMWRHNFGLAVDWWDHVFRTYKPVEGWEDKVDPALRDRPLWKVKWW